MKPQSLIDFSFFLSNNLISEYGFVFSYSALILGIAQIGLAVSPYGKIRLGEKVTFSNFSYWSMICACGMGVAPLFWSVIEPVSHAKEGLDLMDNMVWTFHNWMIGAGTYYGAFGLAFAYLSNKQIKSIIDYPLVRIGLAVATCIGLALTFLYVIELFGSLIALPIILILSILSIKYKMGIKTASELTVIGSLMLILFVQFSVGQSYLGEWLSIWISYLSNELSMMIQTEPKQWLAQWTYNYYAQWLGWAIFLGLFLAKISEGRTIRQIVFGALIAPPILASLYFVVFGLSAIELKADTTYELLANFPLTEWTNGLVLALSLLFFIVQYDSASLILEDLTIKNSRVVWIICIAVLTYLIIHVGHSIDLLRNLTTLVSAPILCLVFYLFLLFLKELLCKHRLTENMK